MRRIAIVLGGALVVVVIGVAAACSFPEVGFAPASAFKDGGFVGIDGSLPPSSTGADAPSTPPDGAPAFDGACGPDPTCDCDSDGDKAIACDGGDCDDKDPRVKSTQTFVADIPKAPNTGDWNCDGASTTEVEAGIDCAGILGENFLDAAAATAACAREGFSDVPPCGASGVFVTCQRNPPTGVVGPYKCINNGPGKSQVQRCR